MNQEDKMSFIEAMEKVIANHEAGNPWSGVHSNTLPQKGKTCICNMILFKRKQKPDGALLKHKRTLRANSTMKTLRDSYWETYSPLVNILSVLLILTLTKIHKLDFKAINFVLAFPQANLKENIWM